MPVCRAKADALLLPLHKAQGRLDANCSHLQMFMLLRCLCSYCVSAKTGYNVKNALTSISAQLAGLPLQSEQTSPSTDQRPEERNCDVKQDTKPIGKRPRLLQALRGLADRCCFPCR
jgi:hypothetical protein